METHPFLNNEICDSRALIEPVWDGNTFVELQYSKIVADALIEPVWDGNEIFRTAVVDLPKALIEPVWDGNTTLARFILTFQPALIEPVWDGNKVGDASRAPR